MKEITCPNETCGKRYKQPFPDDLVECVRCGTSLRRVLKEFFREERLRIKAVERTLRNPKEDKGKTSITLLPETHKKLKAARKHRQKLNHPVWKMNEIIEDALHEYFEKYRL